MSDSIGRIPVPDLVASGTAFPSIPCDYGVGFSQQRPIVTHQFGTADAKIEQRFAVGIGPRKFQFKRSYLNLADRRKLKAFWEGLPTDSTPPFAVAGIPY